MMSRIAPRLILLSVIALAAPAVPAAAQGPASDIRLRLAQSYERSNDFESALRVYGELFAEDSSDFTLIEALKRCHLKLKRHDDAIALIEHGLRLNPADPGALAQLGTVWFMKGDEPMADAAWNRAIAFNPADEMTHRLVGSAMVQVRQFERAVAVYQAARTTLRNATVFSSDIAYLYGVMQKYRESASEYLAMLRAAPAQLGYVQSRLASFTGNEAGLREATAVVAEAAAAEPRNVEIRRLRAWLAMEGKDYATALAAYREIDALSGAGGAELFAFGERALNEGSYRSASGAFEEVIARHPHFREMPRARFGLARCLEELDDAGPGGDTASGARLARASELYGRLVFDHANTDVAARALFRLAMIRKERLGDARGAKEYLERIAREYKIFLPTAVDARLALGSVHVELDELDRAAAVYAEVAGPPPFGGAERERAALRLAELKFFRGDYAGATAILADLTRNPVSDAANDAIPLRMLIADHADRHPAELRAYAKGRLLRAQRRDAEAIGVLDAALAADTAGPLADRFSYLRGELLAAAGRHRDAAAAFTLIVDRMPESLLRDRAMFAAAGANESVEGGKPHAISLYERLLERYPNSIHANAARRRIRELRGDSI